MKLNQISDNLGARKNRNRVGRGMASGNGKTAGRGMKGLGARSGGTVRPGFEGGQFPLYRRIPMRGFNNSNFTKEYTVINVGDLQQMVDEKRLDASKAITIEALQAAGVTKKAKDGLKVLGNGDVTVKLNIQAIAASKSAIEKVAKAGGELAIIEGKAKPEGKLPAKDKGEKVSRLAKKNAAKTAK